MHEYDAIKNLTEVFACQESCPCDCDNCACGVAKKAITELQALRAASQPALPTLSPIKYTRIRDIPQFTRKGNYEVDMSFEYLAKWIASEQETMDLQMTPDFQRGHVWTEEQQIAYVEYLLRGGTSGRVLYFNYPDDPESGRYNMYVCVDGLQRATAIQRFVHDELLVFGSHFSDFEDSLLLERKYTLRVNINNLKTKREVLQWYIDFNAGGTPHSNEELQRVKDMLNMEPG